MRTLAGTPQNILIGALGRLDFWTFLKICAVPAMFTQFVVVFFVWLLISARVSGGSGVAKRIRSAQQGDHSLGRLIPAEWMQCDRGRVGCRGECDLGDPIAIISIGFAVFWLALTQTLPVLPER